MFRRFLSVLEAPSRRFVLLGAAGALLAGCGDLPSDPAQARPAGPHHAKALASVSVASYGAVPNDAGDDTQAFQAAVNAAREVYVPAGDYRISSTVNIPADTRLYGAGATSRLISTAPNLYAMLDAVGPNDSPVYDVVVEHLKFQGGSGDRIHAFRTRWGQRVRFSDNVVRTVGMINVDNSSDVQVLRNDGEGGTAANQHAVDMNFSRLVTVRGNQVRNYTVGIQWWGGEADPRRGGFSRVKGAGSMAIDSNTVANVSAGIWGSNGEHIVAQGNTVENCADVCLDAEGSHDVRFVGNTARNAGSMVMASFYFSSRIVFENNIVSQDGRAWPGHVWGSLAGVRLFYLVNPTDEPDSITVTLRGNQFSYASATNTAYRVGLIEKEPSREMIVDDNTLLNSVVHMAANNNGVVRVTNNVVALDRDAVQFPGIYVGSNHNSPSDPIAGAAYVTGNTVISTSAQARAGVEGWQWAWGLTLNTYIQNNHVEGFGTSILYRNDNQAHNWTITGNFYDGRIARGGNWTPNKYVANNTYTGSSTAPPVCKPNMICEPI
jgi:hypothetical protein